jgi:ABC-type transporter Mla subunit MlaD
MDHKLKGRPILTGGKRTKKIDARFTQDEYNVVLDMEKALGLKKTDLVRMRLLQNSKNVIVNARELITQLDQVGGELGRAGNNINQLAKHANVLNKKRLLSPVVVDHFNNLMENYNRLQRDLEVALRKIIRAMVS